ncbi:MAG: PIN domain-containing protein [Actinomycetota bacterium]|nr:PIN domain-containing protein [Actinomycetota bacterium]
MTYIDAYGLVALIANEAAAQEVEELLRRDRCRVVAVNLAEVIDVAARTHGYPLGEIRAAVEPVILGGQLTVAISDESDAWLAAEIRASGYHRSKRPLSMADCFLLAHALSTGEAVATSDPHVAEIARARGVTIIPLPDTDGTRP